MIAELPPGFELRRGWAKALCNPLSDVLVRTLPLEARTVRVFGKVHPMPRLTAWMGEAEYTYSGVRHAPAPMPEWLARLRGEVSLLALHHSTALNSVLANYYRDGSDSVAWHADDEIELGPEPTIASVSLGGGRRFSIRPRLDDGSRWHIDLEHGDLLIMSGRSQADYLHAVPKTSRASAPRLNLTFRRIGVAYR